VALAVAAAFRETLVGQSGADRCSDRRLSVIRCSSKRRFEDEDLDELPLAPDLERPLALHLVTPVPSFFVFTHARSSGSARSAQA